MFDVRVKRHVEEDLDVEGSALRLISNELALTVSIAGSHFGVGYRGPARVESAGESRKIVDHMLLLRLAVLALMMLGMTRRWVR